MAYICLECGNVFEEPTRWEEKHGLEHGPYEPWSGCPACLGGYADAVLCNSCNEYFPDGAGHHTSEHGTLCEACYNELERTED